MSYPISFFVAGTPKPQGSKRAFNRPGSKHPTMVESAGEALKDWRASVRYTAAAHSRQIKGAVDVHLTFQFVRPKSHFGSGANSAVLKPSAPLQHTKKPDIDKLTRAVLDALTNVAIEDDSSVVGLQVQKRYSTQQGCRITITKANS